MRYDNDIRVVTASELEPREAHGQRQADSEGVIVGQGTGPKGAYEVEHDDGSRAFYYPDEIQVLTVNRVIANNVKLRADLAEALKDRDQAIHLLMPYALQFACSKAGVSEIDQFTECGECHNCKARAFVTPIVKWVKKGWRHPGIPFK